MSRDGVVVEGPLGRIELPGAVLAGLVVAAAEQVEGVRVRRPRRGLDVTVDNVVRVEIELAAPLGAVLPGVAGAVQEQVSSAVAATTRLEVGAVDVTIAELDG